MTSTAVVTPRSILVRTADQGLWSAAVFVFTLTAGLTLDVGEFAALSAASALAFVAVGVARAWAISAPVVSGARDGRRADEAVDVRSARRAAAVCAAAAGTASFVWVAHGAPVLLAVVLAALVVAMVSADLPRQVLVITGRFGRATVLAGLYAAGAGVSALVVAAGVRGAVLQLWVVTAVVVVAAGHVLCGPAETVTRAAGHGAVAWRLAAEAVYLGVGSQIATLLLFAIDDDTATAGIRFAYSLVFAPAFVLVQSVQPLILRQFAELSGAGSRAVTAAGARWAVAVSIAMTGCGAIGATVIRVLDLDGPSTALAFVVPVGVSLVAAQVFEIALMAARFVVSPVVTHRARLASVIVDIVAQVIGVAVAGASGLVVALVLTGAVRAAVSAGVLVLLPSRGER